MRTLNLTARRTMYGTQPELEPLVITRKQAQILLSALSNGANKQFAIDILRNILEKRQ